MTRTGYDTWIQRVHKQHNSLVVVVPVRLAERKAIKAGDYLVFSASERGELIKVRKFIRKGGKDG